MLVYPGKCLLIVLCIGGCVSRSVEDLSSQVLQDDKLIKDSTIISVIGNNAITTGDGESHQEYSTTSPIEDEVQSSAQLATLAVGLIAASIVLIQLSVLLCFGQPLISKSGRLKHWDNDITGPENSQHLTDWYTFTHVLHGFIFYAVTALIMPSWPVSSRFLVALGTEAGWEIVENSPQVIQRYRKTALAQGYTGDSIVNSIFDTLAMTFGFYLTYYIPVWVIIGIALGEELVLGYVIRDNLILNIIQLIYPFERISKWQARTGNPGNDGEF